MTPPAGYTYHARLFADLTAPTWRLWLWANFVAQRVRRWPAEALFAEQRGIHVFLPAIPYDSRFSP